MRHVDSGRHGERGAVIVLFSLAAVVLLLVTGLVVDLGLAHVSASGLSKAVDAGALAAARHIASGPKEATEIAKRVAAANFGSTGDGGTGASYAIAISVPQPDVYRIEMTGSASSPTFFSKFLGKENIDVVRSAEATRYPLDLSLVLDLSASLDRSGSFGDLQRSAKNFIKNFDDATDRIGIITYSTWATEAMTLQKNFQAKGSALIDGLKPITDTNIEEGLRLAKVQLESAKQRDVSMRVVVLFTDGRPTAFADNFLMENVKTACPADTWPSVTTLDSNKNGVPDCYSGVAATYVSGGSYRGLFQRDDGQKITGFKSLLALLTSNASSSTSPQPYKLPDGRSVNGDNIRQIGADQAEEWASALRNQGYTVYSLGLGDPNAKTEGEAPDLDFLRRIANADGIVSGAQPKGEMMFAPSAAELDAQFAKMADRILTRLTR